MCESHDADDELGELLAALREDVISDAQAQRLMALLRDDPHARRRYIHCMAIVANLRGSMADSLPARPDFLDAIASAEPLTSAAPVGLALPAGVAVELPSRADVVGRRQSSVDNQDLPVLPIVLDLSPAVPAPFFSLQSPLGSFLFSYTTSALLLGIAMLIGWACKVSYDGQVADSTRAPVTQIGNLPEEQARQPAPHVPEPPLVARITGMVDCQWADRHTAPVGFDRVSLGRTYALASGLMEITYDTGAKVILQGPCTYEVESTTGGYLAMGKLTARVDVAAKSQALSPKSQDPRPKTLFFVRTPTAVVTDLGTEFAVEVDNKGCTESHVYVGKVKVVYVGVKGEGSQTATLRAGQTARFDDGRRIVVVASPEKAGGFVRRIGLDPADAVRIVEKFDGGKLGAAFGQMPPGRYLFKDGAAVYQQPRLSDGRQSRGYICTVATDFRDRDFVFEATVDAHLDAPDLFNVGHRVFFGFGSGELNPNRYEEITCGLVAVFNLDHQRISVSALHPDSTATDDHGKEFTPAGFLSSGRHRFRMVKHGNWVRFSVGMNYTGRFHADFASPPIDLRIAAPLLNATNSRLLFGTGNCDTMTVRFEDISIAYSKTPTERSSAEASGARGGAAKSDRPDRKEVSP